MKTLIEEMEQLVRNCQFDEVERRLSKLGQVDRAFAVAVSNIARRIHRPHYSIKILQAIVRADNKLQVPPSSLEKIEYAEALRRVGAVSEAWQLLIEVDEALFPQALILKAYCLFSEWKYEQAIPLLKKYLALTGLTPYEQAIGKLNLASALIHRGYFAEAVVVLHELQAESQSAGFLMVYGNTLELSAQVLIFEGKYPEAIQCLRKAQKVLTGSGFMGILFVHKWLAIAESLQQGQTTNALREVRQKAKAEKHWETVRDCEFYRALVNKDSTRFERLFFGTPYASFRERILRSAGSDFKLPETYLWSATKSPVTFIDLMSGKVSGARTGGLPVGQALHRFLIILCQDFYRPVPIFSVFGKLFPQEYMAESSTGRVHQIISRFRRWVKTTNLDLQLEEIDGAYKLILGKGVGLRVPAKALPLEGRLLEWLYLKNSIAREKFDISEAIQAVSWSRTSTRRVLHWAIAENQLRKLGSGTSTSYQIVKPEDLRKVI